MIPNLGAEVQRYLRMVNFVRNIHKLALLCKRGDCREVHRINAEKRITQEDTFSEEPGAIE